MEKTSAFHHDRPLSPGSKAILVASAAAAILLCYLSYLLAMVFLALLLAVEFLLLFAGARFGLAGVMANRMRRHAPLLGVLFRSFWLGQGTDYRITLLPPEAPRLFALLENLSARLQIAPPHEVSIEMSSGAWVRLPGYRQGAGRTILGIGYDLLAGLSVAEVEAVMAHEMTHAKLVRRGLKHWLNAGLARTVRVAHGLGEIVEAYRQAKEDFHVGTGLFQCANVLVGIAARLIAKYSRQDEFEADRGAAELCGAEPLATSLQRLEAMQKKLGRLPWPERVAQMQLDESFSRWLVQELAVPVPDSPPEEEARDPFSTHPSLRDRLAALPDLPPVRRDETPAISLLAEPDRTAEKLMAEIQRVNAEQEQKDAQSLAKWARKSQRSTTTQIQWKQLPSLLLVPAGLIIAIVAFADGFMWEPFLIGTGMMAAGIWIWRLGRYQDRRALPVPPYSALRQAWRAERPKNLTELEKQHETELRALSTTERKDRRRMARLLDEADAALLRCDYLRAHVAARLALGLDENSLEGATRLAVASAGLNLPAQAGTMLEFIQTKSGLATPATIWGAGWTLALLADWARAEALLWQKHHEQPRERTVLLLLALAQLRRNKLQSAALNAAKGIALAPPDADAVKLHVEILLEAGRLRDAAAQLAAFETAAQSDPELAMLLVRLHLLQRKPALAHTWAKTLRTADNSAHRLVHLGVAFETARSDDDALRFFNEAIAAGFYPEAHLGLARLAVARHDKALARTHLTSAINLEKTAGENSAGAVAVFQIVLGGLVSLEEPRADCRAWLATFPNGPAPATPAALAGRTFLVYAADSKAAEGYVDSLLAAVQPATPAARASTLYWRPAPKDQQPIRPVRPGVDCVL